MSQQPSASLASHLVRVRARARVRVRVRVVTAAERVVGLAPVEASSRVVIRPPQGEG